MLSRLRIDLFYINHIPSLAIISRVFFEFSGISEFEAERSCDRPSKPVPPSRKLCSGESDAKMEPANIARNARRRIGP